MWGVVRGDDHVVFLFFFSCRWGDDFVEFRLFVVGGRLISRSPSFLLPVWCFVKGSGHLSAREETVSSQVGHAWGSRGCQSLLC